MGLLVTSSTALAQTSQRTTVTINTPHSIAVSNIAKDSATIKWKTDVATTTSIWYQEVGNETMTALSKSNAKLAQDEDPEYTTDHTTQLTNLRPGTKYLFSVGGTSQSGRLLQSGDNYLTTLANTPDNTDPIITNTSVTGITRKLAVINVETNEPTTIKISYTVQGSIDTKFVVGGAFLRKHTLYATNLSARTNYTGTITATDRDGKTTQKDVTWTTQSSGNTLPIISNIKTTDVTSTGALVSWTTDLPTTSLVWYYQDRFGNRIASLPNKNNPDRQDEQYTTEHSVRLESLQPKTKYRVVVGGADKSGRLAKSENISITTSSDSDTTAPIGYNLSVNVNNRSSSATIQWTTNEDSDSVVQYSTDPNFESSSIKVMSNPRITKNHNVTLSGLPINTMIYFRASSKDGSGNSGIPITGVLYLDR